MPRTALLAVVIAGTLSGCGGGDDGDGSADATIVTSAAASPRTTVAAPDAPAVPEALDFTGLAVGGGGIDARAYAGTPVAFWFWAPY
jgi:hypothetical protein